MQSNFSRSVEVVPAMQFTFSGDVTGSDTKQVVVGIQKHNVTGVPDPTDAQALTWNGTSWTPDELADEITFSGDLVNGNLPATQEVVGLQGRQISTTTPNTSELITWNGSQWTPLPPPETLSFSGDIFGTDATQTVVGLRQKPLADTPAPDVGDLLTYSTSEWAPAPAPWPGDALAPYNTPVWDGSGWDPNQHNAYGKSSTNVIGTLGMGADVAFTTDTGFLNVSRLTATAIVVNYTGLYMIEYYIGAACEVVIKVNGVADPLSSRYCMFTNVSIPMQLNAGDAVSVSNSSNYSVTLSSCGPYILQTAAVTTRKTQNIIQITISRPSYLLVFVGQNTVGTSVGYLFDVIINNQSGSASPLSAVNQYKFSSQPPTIGQQVWISTAMLPIGTHTVTTSTNLNPALTSGDFMSGVVAINGNDIITTSPMTSVEPNNTGSSFSGPLLFISSPSYPGIAFYFSTYGAGPSKRFTNNFVSPSATLKLTFLEQGETRFSQFYVGTDFVSAGTTLGAQARVGYTGTGLLVAGAIGFVVQIFNLTPETAWLSVKLVY